MPSVLHVVIEIYIYVHAWIVFENDKAFIKIIIIKKHLKVFQIYFWLSSMGVGTEGKKYGNKKNTYLISIVFLFALDTNSDYLLKWSQWRSILANYFLIEMTETQPPLSQE